jgi:tRNA G37 N-methylase Trm5
MTYDSDAVHSVKLPKQLGCYEQELHSALERFLSHPYERIINIGCGEGYYSVGFALRLSQSHVYAFDCEPNARELCNALAAANGVEKRVHVHESCTQDALRKVLEPGALIVCDCEGCEVDLLQPELLPVLNECDLLVELHDNDGLNASGNVLPRFRVSHATRVIPAVDRTAEDFDRAIASLLESDADHPAATALRALTPDQKRIALAEDRYSDMRWACLSASAAGQ